MKINLDRHDVCNLLKATTAVKYSFVDELNDENITEDRKQSIESTIEMWGKLHDEIRRQLDEFDAKTK